MLTHITCLYLGVGLFHMLSGPTVIDFHLGGNETNSDVSAPIPTLVLLYLSESAVVGSSPLNRKFLPQHGSTFVRHGALV